MILRVLTLISWETIADYTAFYVAFPPAWLLAVLA